MKHYRIAGNGRLQTWGCRTGISMFWEKVIDMMEELEYIIQQNRELRKAADDVMELRRCVNGYRNLIREAWKSQDAKGLEDAAERLSHMLGNISVELSEVAHDLLTSVREPEEDDSERKTRRE